MSEQTTRVTKTVGIRVLGAFAIAVDGQDIGARWQNRRVAELVQLLAVSPGRRLSRDQVIDALWPHLDADAGAANLRKAAHYARQALGDQSAVELRLQQVALFPDADATVDATVFAEAASSALRTGGADDAAAALQLWGGEPLPDVRYEDWAAEPRHRLDALHHDLLRLSGGWEALVEADPLDEQACQELMRQALADGRRHRAITAYGRLRQALLQELGVHPDPSTEELYRQCLSTDPPADGGSILVGRSRELAAIDAALSGRAGSPATLLVITGEAGIGKSTLCDEVVRRAAAAGRRCARVTASDPTASHAVVAALVEQLVAEDPALPERIPAKTRSVLASITPVMEPAEPLEVPVTRHQMTGAVQRLVAEAGRLVPGSHDGEPAATVLVVDDAHRADASSLEVLSRLADRTSERSLLVLSLRDDVVLSDAQAAQLARAHQLHRTAMLTPAPLDEEAVGALAASAGASLDRDAIAALTNRSSGNPFVVLELLSPGQGTQDAIAHRFVDVPDDVLDALRRLALVPERLDLPMLTDLLGCDESEAARVLDVALSAGVLVVVDGAYAFRHDLVQSSLAEQLPPHRAAAVHAEAADRLAARGAAPGAVARHLVAAGRSAEAVPWLVRAAEDAMRHGGYLLAAELLEQAIAIAPGDVPALRRRAEAYDALGDRRAVPAYAAAARVATAQEAEELRPLQALAQIKQGDAEGALVTVAGTDPHSLESRLARALTLCGAAALGVADPLLGSGPAAEGKRLAIESGDPGAIVVASWADAAAAHARGELRSNLRQDLLDTYALPHVAVNVFDGQLCITQRLLYGARPYDDVIAWTDDFLAEAQRLSAARGVAFGRTLRGEAELLSGRLDDAEQDLTEGRRLHQAMGAATGEAFSLQRLAELAFLRDDRRRARSLLDDALAVARDSDVGFHLLDRIYGTRIALAEEPDEALAMVREAEDAVRGPLETCPGCRITLAVPAALAVARAGDLERLEEYEAACEYLAEVVMRLPAWFAALEEVRGQRCLAHGDRAGAVAHLADAASGFDSAGQPFDARRCRTALEALG